MLKPAGLRQHGRGWIKESSITTEFTPVFLTDKTLASFCATVRLSQSACPVHVGHLYGIYPAKVKRRARDDLQWGREERKSDPNQRGYHEDKFNSLTAGLISCLLMIEVFIYVLGRIDRRYQSDWFDPQGVGRYFYRFMLLLIAGTIVVLAVSL